MSGTIPLRPMFVTASLSHGGAERHSVSLVNHLASRGHECHVVYVQDQHPSQIERLELGARGTLRPLEAKRYLDRRALDDFTMQLREVRPSVIVSANPYALMYSALARASAGLTTAPLVVTYHSTILTSGKERLKMLLYRPFLWNADRMVFVCRNQKRYAVRRAIFARSNEVIYNGVDVEWYRPRTTPEQDRAARTELGFGPDDYVIGISAWLRPEKNHVQLVEALAMLRARGIEARVLMIGDGEMRGTVEARARALGVSESVVITGFRPDVRPLIAACRAIVLCSLSETFSLAALEAMALARPVVHAELGGAAEMIRHGVDGFLFPAGDTAALAQRLTALADAPLALEMGARARQTVEARFSQQGMVDRYERMLQELQALRGASAGRQLRRPA